ncbi:MAG: class I SAM-dependent methyltransferase [Flavobacteriaceae bacterium]|nr:class I SAM-dependent methyltransferase [Flavobacteriaceae bacterium]
MANQNKLYKGLTPYLNCKDHTVSQESYELLKNNKYELLVTSPVPLDLPSYYKSEAYISHTDSRKSFLDKIYQSVKKYTLKKKVSLLNSFSTPSKKVLDIGSGTGDFLRACKNSNWTIFGVEPSAQAREISESKGIPAFKDINEVREENFDVITLWHVLEHIENLTEYIQLLKQKLSPTGKLIIAVPNYKSFDANHYKEFWAAFDVPRHLWHFSKKSIELLFSEASMSVEKVLPMKFDAYYVSMLSEKYKTGKNNFLKAFWIGFLSNWKGKRVLEYSSHIYVLKNR